MIESIVGSKNAERVLLYIFAREQGYTREIARFWNADADSIHKQLVRLERDGVLFSKSLGKTVVYSFNPRYAFLKELKALLNKALSFYPKDEQDSLLIVRRRPRRKDKPL